MQEENHQLLLITRIKEVYLQFQSLVKGDLLEEEDIFEDVFQHAKKLAAKKITHQHKYVVVGITKAGKSTLLNKLIGKNLLITNEKRATAIKWAVKFHDSEKFLLKVYRNT